MDFYRYAANNVSPGYLLRNQPWENQIPVTEAYVLWFIQTTGVPVNAWTVRFPIALLGVFAVFFMFKLCSSVFGRDMGLLAAFLTAVNPFAVSISMEAYYYSGVICFSAMFYWASIRLFFKLKEQSVKNRDWVLWTISASLMCSTHMTTWAVFGAVWVLVVFLVWKKFHPSNLAKTTAILFTCAVIVFFVVLPWLTTAVRTYLFGDQQPLGLEPAPWTNFLQILGETVPIFTFGKTPAGILAILLITASGLIAGLMAGKTKSPKQEHGDSANHNCFFLMAGCAAAGNIALCAAMGQGHAKYVYFSALFPLVICCLVYFFNNIASILASRRRYIGNYGLVGAGILCLVLWVVPLHAVVNLEGRPTPYKTMVDYINTHTRPGTLVLVDRWFEPWNELTLYPLEDGRQWTFTVPNEPAQTAVQMQWHKSVKGFFEKYPEAVYMPLVNSYRDPSMGPWYIGAWDWPDQHFSEHIQLKHTAGIRLRDWGLAAREDFYEANDGRLNVNIYFNTRETLIARARNAGYSALRFYGPGWNYAKLWQPQQNTDPRVFQTFWLHAGFYMENNSTIEDMSIIHRMPQDKVGSLINTGRFADYRIPNQATYLDLYNLTREPGSFTLQVVAFSPGGNTACRIGGRATRFSQILSKKEMDFKLEPGHNIIPFEHSPEQGFLLVLDIKLK